MGASRTTAGRWIERRAARAAARALPLADRVPGGVRLASGRDSTRSWATRRSRARTRSSASNAANYGDWLKSLHAGSHGNADLVAHFFRRAFGLLRDGGAFGLIATNTIGQGDTRATGLRWICKHGGEIFSARRRLKWPGMAAVVVSVVHACEGRRSNDAIARRARGRADHRVPVPLRAVTTILCGWRRTPARASSGATCSAWASPSTTLTATGVASSLAEMRRLLADDPRNGEAIFPYIGGAEVNDSPDACAPPLRDQLRRTRRGGMPAALAGADGDRRGASEARAPADNRESYRRYWWQLCRKAPGAMAGHRRAGPRTCDLAGQQRVRVRLSARWGGLHENTVVFPFADCAPFAILQSRVHEVWARFFGSTLKDDLRYTPSDCFETFPFPEDWTSATEPRGRWARVLRVPRAAHGRARRGAHEDLQPIPRPRGDRPGHPRARASSTRRWIAPCSTPTVGTTSTRRASSCSTTSDEDDIGPAAQAVALPLARRRAR